VQEVADSRQQTEELLREKRQNENVLLDKILNHEGTMKSLILELADSMAERYELLDPMFPSNFSLSQISSMISRALAPNPIADFVRRCLPDKYKNTNMQRAYATIDQINNIIEHCGTDSRKRIEECSNLEIETQVQFIDKAKNLNDDVGTILKNRKQEILQEAIRRGMKEIAGEKIRDQISCYDFRMRVPDNQTLHWYNKQTSENLIATGEAIAEFGAKDFLDFPPHDVEIAKKYTETSRIWRILFLTVREKKWSGDIGFWMDRNYHQKVQSSHDSGNSTKFDSTLCAWCSRDIDIDPLDRHIMQYDRDSPTTYRCDNCGGTAVLDKGNSREQVGDKKEENDRLAEDIINHASFYGEIFGDWRERWLNPTIYARKRAIQEEFSISSMGKEKTVVPRKKVCPRN
jgi:hypothetical protein